MWRAFEMLFGGRFSDQSGDEASGSGGSGGEGVDGRWA
jgi:hypothetical protein